MVGGSRGVAGGIAALLLLSVVAMHVGAQAPAPTVLVMQPNIHAAGVYWGGESGWDGRYVYSDVFGCDSGTHCWERILRYDTVTDTAELRSHMPVWHGLFGFDGRYGYVVGGLDQSYNPSFGVFRYDPETDTWTKRQATLDLPRGSGASRMVWDGSMFTIVGAYHHCYSSSVCPVGSGVCGTGCDARILRYDPALDQILASSQSSPLVGPAVVAGGGKVYIFGGQVGGLYVATTYSPEVLEYDPVADTLVTRTEIVPGHMAGAATAWDGSRAYIIGGMGGIGAMWPLGWVDFEFSADILVFDPTNGTVSHYATAPWPLLGSATWTGSKVYVTSMHQVSGPSFYPVDLEILCFPGCSYPTLVPSVPAVPIVIHPPQEHIPGMQSTELEWQSMGGQAEAHDDDTDGIDDRADNCPAIPNISQTDLDGDNLGDECDSAPCGENKPFERDALGAFLCPGGIAPAQRLGSTSFSDVDKDGIIDVADNCPRIPNRDQADLDGDAFGDVCDSDQDGDGVADKDLPAGATPDNCPVVPNVDQRDSLGDGMGDACRVVPSTAVASPRVQPVASLLTPDEPSVPWWTPAFAGLAAIGFWLRRKAPAGIVVLFSRLSQNSLLQHPVRGRIVEQVQGEPGIHFQALVRSLGMGRGIVRHHLDVLRAGGLLVEKRSGRYACFYPPGSADAGGALLKSKGAKRLMQAIQATPGCSVADAARAAGLKPASASYHIDRLAAAGILERRSVGAGVQLHATRIDQS